MKKDPVLELLEKYLIENEGFETKVYKDSLGIPTIGVGYNLNQRNAANHMASLGLNYNDVRNGKVKLTKGQVRQLLEITVGMLENVVTKQYPLFGTFSITRQIVLLDLAFNVGATRLAGFKNFNNYVNKGMWLEASIELLDSSYAIQVGARAARNSKAIATDLPPDSIFSKPAGRGGSRNGGRTTGNSGSRNGGGGEGYEPGMHGNGTNEGNDANNEGNGNESEGSEMNVEPLA